MTDTVFNPFESEEITPPFSDHWEAKRRLAQAIRALSEVLVTSTPSIDDMNDIAERLELQARQFAKSPRIYGQWAFQADGNHGTRGEVNHELNALAGWSNPLSPGLNMWIENERAYGTVTCGWTYEGPPGHIHGGIVAAIFDQFMGMAQMMGKAPGMTGRLTTRYHRPTPLNVELKLEAWLETVEGRKTTVHAEMRNGDEVTATCEALFIRPKGGIGLRDMDQVAEPDAS
ncbi:MAG: PaaI family thioesterase [Halieaceae bacterium]|nr:PaaI family thioesterase [Halieaceae bacterium]